MNRNYPLANDNIVVRDARGDEAGAIRAVTLAAYVEYEPIMGPRFWEGYKAEILKTLAEDTMAAHIVAVQDNTIVGSVLLIPVDVNAYGDLADAASAPEIRL